MDRAMVRDGIGIILSFEDLKAKLTSGGRAGEWTVHLVNSDVDGSIPTHAQVRRCESDLVDMPNELVYRFPVIVADPQFWPLPLVLMHSAVAAGQVEGLYFEGDKLVNDSWEDAERFWTPLRQLLGLSAMERVSQ